MRVLSLTTTAWRSFYESQEKALEEAGVEYTTLEVPGDHRAFDEDVRKRSVIDYLRYYPQVVRNSFRDYDLVHANYGLTAPYAVGQFRLPVVCTLWGGEFIGNRFERPIRFFSNLSDELIVPSNAMADRVEREAHVIPFPVDTDLFRPILREKAREAVGWDPDETIVLFPYAKSRYEKNYPLARRTVEAINERGSVGDVSLRAVANRPYEEVPWFVNAADAVLITSRWESGPMVVKEALACTVPVVSTDVGFSREVLSGVNNAAVCGSDAELVDALARVLERDEPADGRDRIAGYGTAEMGDRIRAVYERCLR